MTTVYLDTTALVRLVRREHGSELAVELWNRAPLVATSRLSDVELRAVLAAGVRRGLLDPSEHAAALQLWESLWAGVYVVEPLAAVTALAADLVGRHPLRGGDAVHLASALVLAPDVVMAVWDEHVAAAAAAEGLTVVPGEHGVPGLPQPSPGARARRRLDSEPGSARQ
ncbi:type II toxin-antitoxin system VapC family toxin [Luteimicrobium subarcticum]|uniref:Ribonuclease VapC n=1 Tax=Luteimicrobium subarcticum TaxID=620910 RepID=A0A2M8WVZ6_9MICO|nr:type II toxin-antitoxin system VapC family toxin [Luteimicrobium subarcticum]PJI95087.1 hypothetical protein CLV34_0940 [Luteimicrobium subarcticum]